MSWGCQWTLEDETHAQESIWRLASRSKPTHTIQITPLVGTIESQPYITLIMAPSNLVLWVETQKGPEMAKNSQKIPITFALCLDTKMA